MKTTLEQWRMLRAVIEYGSFGKAAQVIHKSQSSINMAVRKLQDSLGIQLVETVGKRTVLTEAGKLLLKRGNIVIDEIKQIEAIAAQLSEGVETTLEVAIDSVFPYEFIYRAFDRLSCDYPNTRVEFRETILSGSNELIRNGEAVVAISPEPLSTALKEIICQVEFIAVASPQHPLIQKNEHLSQHDLRGSRQIVLRDSAQHNRTDAGWLEATQRWTVTNVATSIDLVRQGFGYAWLPKNKIAQELASGELVAMPIENGGSRLVNLYLVIADEDKLGPAAKCFIETIRSYKDLSVIR